MTYVKSHVVARRNARGGHGGPDKPGVGETIITPTQLRSATPHGCDLQGLMGLAHPMGSDHGLSLLVLSYRGFVGVVASTE